MIIIILGYYMCSAQELMSHLRVNCTALCAATAFNISSEENSSVLSVYTFRKKFTGNKPSTFCFIAV